MIQIAEVIKELPPNFKKHFVEFALDNVLYFVALRFYTVINPEVYNGPIKRFFRRGINFITKEVKKNVCDIGRGV